MRHAPSRRLAKALGLLALLLGPSVVFAQCVSLTTAGSAYTQNFDTLSNTAGSTTNNLTITGWFMTETGGGARDNEQYAVDTGGSNTGDTFSYGSAAATDRALGGLQSGTLIPVVGACFTNNTGSTLTSLDVAYNGEQWRIANTAAARDDRLDFQFSTDATSLATGTWTDANALDFTNPIKTAGTAGALDGNNAANRTAISSSVTGQSIANGATFWIRWNDLNASGADDGLAVDDFSLTPQGAAPLPNLSISDVTTAETNAGTTTFLFTVSLDAPAGAGGVTFDIATADGTATVADNDYVAKSLTGQIIASGNSTYSFDVSVNGDSTVEPNETFFANITNVTGASLADGQGQATIFNDDVALPNLSINDVTAVETNSGTTTFVFTASLDAPAPADVSFDIATADGSATVADGDYLSNSVTGLTIATGQQSATFSVTVNGDDKYEPSSQQFLVNITNVTSANVTDAQGVGTITDDDSYPTLSASAAVSVNEGNAGNQAAAITYTLSNPADQDTTITVNTADGTATLANGDYLALTNATATIPAGSLSAVYVGAMAVGDSTVEPDETFSVSVTDYIVGASGRAPKGITLPAPTVVTIVNDDASADLSITVTDSPDPVVQGQDLTYVVTLTNAGPSNADGANFSLPLPAGTTFVSLAQPGLWNCTTPAVGSNGTVSCNDGVVTAAAPGSGKMAVGSAQFTIVANVPMSVVPGTVLSSNLTSSALTADPNGQNNAAVATTTVAAALTPSVPVPALDPRLLALLALVVAGLAATRLHRSH